MEKSKVLSIDSIYELLEKKTDLEKRLNQINMSNLIYKGMRDCKITFIEAPTGIGKTYSSLIPSIVEIGLNNSKILYLTAKIVLQDQLIKKDLPNLHKIVEVDFKYGLLKGRSNYFCWLRFDEAFRTHGLIYQNELDSIRNWARVSRDGDLNEYDDFLVHELKDVISVDYEDCPGRKCPYLLSGACHYFRLVNSLNDLDILVSNYHTFFFNLINGSFPFDFDHILMDEAHHLPEILSSACTRQISKGSLNYFLPRGFALKIVDREPDILLSVLNDLKSLENYVNNLKISYENFFDELQNYCIDPKINKDSKIVTFHKTLSFLEKKGNEIIDISKKILKEFDEWEKFFQKVGTKGLADAKLKYYKRKIDFYALAISDFLSLNDYPNFSYSFSVEKGYLSIEPVYVNGILKNFLDLQPPKSVTLYSATLTPDKKTFSYLENELGFKADNKIVYESVFNYKKQAKIIIPQNFNIDPKSSLFSTQVAYAVERILDDFGGHALVLFTSQKNLNETKRLIMSKKRKYRYFFQGEKPNIQLVEEFSNDSSSVLFGLNSFWEGIDVPGSSLSLLIIDRLPFPNPNDPMMIMREKNEGREVFNKSYLPNAKLSLRQGFGRLIRSKNDIGVFVILDFRVLKWGFLELFRPCDILYSWEAELVRKFVWEGE
ncbi:helicase c2 [Thermodesulfobium narugense DSM 14796]|uniref:Helicase c2 n=1 Tax=Thermodesulfobium narugense DSM 14796 TaxID=747365 RepID=M1E890_9BACT|nr:ATP-dependent DNA helicase [Thermodesulfobium narugense]AEE14324.1 helicase c2 [Thermodesulfobium narugense DSM 14796]